LPIITNRKALSRKGGGNSLRKEPVESLVSSGIGKGYGRPPSKNQIQKSEEGDIKKNAIFEKSSAGASIKKREWRNGNMGSKTSKIKIKRRGRQSSKR